MRSGTTLLLEHVAGRGGAVAFGRCVRPKCPGAGERARVSGCIDGNELAVSDVGRRPSHDPHRLCCRRAECHEVEKLRPERRIGDVLTPDRANLGACIGAARSDRG